MKTLIVHPNPMCEATAWRLLGNDAGLYIDNGYEPDGSAWLPSEPVFDGEADAVVEAGLGRYVEAVWLDGSEEIAAYIKRPDLLDEALIDDQDAWYAAVDDWCAHNDRLWAHFGAWCAGDEVLVVALVK